MAGRWRKRGKDKENEESKWKDDSKEKDCGVGVAAIKLVVIDRGVQSDLRDIVQLEA